MLRLLVVEVVSDTIAPTSLSVSAEERPSHAVINTASSPNNKTVSSTNSFMSITVIYLL